MAKNWKTKLIHSDAKVPEGFRSLSVGVQRASTVLFPDAASVRDDWDQYEVGYTYGLYGTPTTIELAARVCELEGGFRTLITPGGQCAISLINLAFLKAGDHVLIPESVYTPNRKFAVEVLRRFGVEVGFYAPEAGAEIQTLFRENTRMVWCESPGSITLEVQAVPSIAAVAHRAGVMIVLDNT
jgi:cysteine-S-conjugate beta-lyase